MLPLLFWIAMAGGVFSAIAYVKGRRDLAYVPAIALGFLAFLLWELRGEYARHP